VINNLCARREARREDPDADFAWNRNARGYILPTAVESVVRDLRSAPDSVAFADAAEVRCRAVLRASCPRVYDAWIHACPDALQSLNFYLSPRFCGLHTNIFYV